MKKTVLARGRYMRLVREGRWEYVERTNCSAIAVIVARTPAGKVLFVEQYRVPVKASAIEFPAGLVNDGATKHVETIENAARRELLEETGWRAARVKRIFAGPISAGLTSETITFLLASGLRKVHSGGGDETEKIRVHEIALKDVERWLKRMKKNGRVVDPKVYAGLYFLHKRQN